MKLADFAKNLMLDALDESQTNGWKYSSLHTAYSATGSNEVTGGSPAYARKATTWGAAASGSKAATATFPVFDVPAGTTVAWVGGWDASTAGNFLGMTPNGGGALKRFAVNSSDVTSDTLDAPAHGFSNGNTVVVWGAALPTGLAVGTVYYVVGAATDTLQLSATSGGSAINLTAVGAGLLQAIVLEVFGAQGTHTISALSVALDAVA